MKTILIILLTTLSFSAFSQRAFKIVRIKYITALTLRQDFQRAFPDWDGTKEDISDAIGHRHVRIKVYRDSVTGVRTHAIVYLLVRQAFTVPAWIQGEVLLDNDVDDPVDHYFMGHEPEIIVEP